MEKDMRVSKRHKDRLDYGKPAERRFGGSCVGNASMNHDELAADVERSARHKLRSLRSSHSPFKSTLAQVRT